MKGKGDIIYGATDFERYHSGNMSGAEMYALEKAALSDPFLEEALEGYAYTKTAKNDIEDLDEKLTSRLEEKKKSGLIFWNRNSFLKVAILIAFLAGSAYIILTQNNKVVENSNLASSAQTELKEIKPADNNSIQENDLLLPENPQIASATAPVIELNKKLIEEKKSIGKNEKLSKSLNSARLEDKAVLKEITVAAAPVKKTKDDASGYLVKGKVVNQLGEPIPFASIVTNKQQINTDITGNYSAFVKDSSVYGNVVASGYKPLQKKLNYSLDETIVLNSNNAIADKVIQQSEAASAKKAVSTRGNTSAKMKAENNNLMLIPAIGWLKYEKYLQDSVRYQTDKRATVQLSFIVNESGMPQQIKVLDGSCAPCNIEAIRLLKQGPAWIYNAQATGLLKVQF